VTSASTGCDAATSAPVVHHYADGAAYEVEFVTAAGATVAVVTLETADLRPVGGSEILHVRSLVGTAA